MKLKYFFLVLIFLSLHTLSVRAQIVVSLQLPPFGIVQKNQLWSMAVVNGGDAISLQIELNMYDLKNGDRVLTATSGTIQISKGVKQLQLNNIGTIQYQYINPLYEIDANQNGYLPFGLFKVCYSFFTNGSKGSELLQDECKELVIDPVSPPILNLPGDSAKLQTKFPSFTWLPPMPVQSFKGLNYELRIVELQQGQNSSEAIQKNLPFAEKGNIKENFYTYPSSLPAFDTTAFYAWQVTAFGANGYSVKSEIWTFSSAKNNSSKLHVTTSFIGLKKGDDPSLFVSNGQIKFFYENIYGDSTVYYQLIKISNGNEQIIRKEKIQISPGENFTEINLDKKRFWNNHETYRFEVINSKGENWKLNIIFIEKEDE